MAAIVVEYARFVEIQQRRMRVVREFKRPADGTGVPNDASLIDQPIDVGETPMPVDVSTTRGTVDVR